MYFIACIMNILDCHCDNEINSGDTPGCCVPLMKQVILIGGMKKKESGEYFSHTLNICSDDQTDYREQRQCFILFLCKRLFVM